MKILTLFVEPMLYGMDQIHEVYEKTEHQFQYIYCNRGLTGKDDLVLPDNSVVCHGNKTERKQQVQSVLKDFAPDFVIINGYVGFEQTTVISYCKRNHIPYAIETDTPLHIPENPLAAIGKKLILRTRLRNKYCYGFPGGTLQKENLVYYGIPEERCFIMPMSVSTGRLLKQYHSIPKKDELKELYGVAGKKVILFVGRLEPVKNVSVLIRAYKRLKSDQTVLMIVGDGSEMATLKAEADGDAGIRFEGYTVFPKLIDYYKLADVFVLPSTYESWGLVVNEAMTMGLPVIVSDHVGCRVDLVENFKNGYIFMDNSTDDLHEKILTVL